jgi:hypothetical protein
VAFIENVRVRGNIANMANDGSPRNTIVTAGVTVSMSLFPLLFLFVLRGTELLKLNYCSKRIGKL